MEKLVSLIREATHVPKPRVKTKPSRASKAERVDTKVHRGKVKKMRSSRPDYD